jgi:hypothetical protein
MCMDAEEIYAAVSQRVAEINHGCMAPPRSAGVLAA